jgi:hypothetical protein
MGASPGLWTSSARYQPEKGYLTSPPTDQQMFASPVHAKAGGQGPAVLTASGVLDLSVESQSSSAGEELQHEMLRTGPFLTLKFAFVIWLRGCTQFVFVFKTVVR